uniref:Diphthine methyltransferase-like n=1 Tax=Phallusia mammillata TaxID=59560 RepID=A0A6F9DAQ7_9ASCI|nr:diphthine methyltransferase-like [Phallusia mammillata]
MGDHDGRATFRGLFQRSLHYRLALSVKCRGGFVQQKDLGVSDNGTSNCDPLFLSTTHLTTALANQGVKFLRKFLDERERVGFLGRILHLLVSHSFAPPADVLANRCSEEHRLLSHNSNCLSQLADIERSDFLSTNCQSPASNVVKTLNELNNGTFSAATLSNQRRGLAMIDLE